ncbi:MAG: peptide chain release factor N(5)-glutamine methyltransferase, partial [Clostridia bacterium]|nr:peptide chain release factor N(5)-glutamine methyltransferase [Clostridia bacterium]
MNKFDLVINHTMEIPEDKIIEFHNGLEKIKDNTPIQYITNHQEFMKLDFYVDENVLIPQPDTEILVEEVLKYVNQIDKTKSSKIKILDLCTGSGAIAVSLAKYIDNCEITATDISNKAIQIAKLNAEKNLVHTKINFIESNMFENLPKTQYDIIVSNPPYIETETILSLSPEVQKEPLLALDGGCDGLKFYKIILKNYNDYLVQNGKVFLEIGYNQKE